uniref:MPN domain-containing protein n=1 Tax=Compsopogon caeruleus TaxID=31354 RepID=A0A7S1THB6_9RHOD|mmetsp:Transcript_7368/g.15046  ORF Transcript_7368/g.15046 Transcript_7368/m.15046 type:complete len:294 (+) Transcript_7368:183-1064(+)
MDVVDSTGIFVLGDADPVHAVVVSPVVLLSVLDHHSRRPKGQRRVIGTLMGTLGTGRVLHVTSSLPVPHAEEGGEVAVNTEFHRTMLELHQKVNPGEVVGWYATGAETDADSMVIHEFYGRECAAPVHILIDTEFTRDKFYFRGFMSTAYQIGKLALSSEFRPVPVSLKLDRSERVGLDALIDRADSSKTTGREPLSLCNELDTIEAALERLLELLDVVRERVDAVVAGDVAGDPKLGRFLSETLARVPKVNVQEFEKLLGDNMRDLLMIIYLSKLSQAQLSLAEELLCVDVK